MSENLASQDLAIQNELGLTYDPQRFTYYEPKREPFRSDKQPEEAEVKPLSEVPYRPVEWIWKGRIPCNKLTLIEGPAESGKSLLAIDLAARLTRQDPMPGETEPTWSVIGRCRKIARDCRKRSRSLSRRPTSLRLAWRGKRN